MVNIRRDILISTREEVGINDDVLFELYNASFDLWRKNGLDAVWLHHTRASLKRQLSKKTIFVAIDKNTNELLGMHVLKANPKANGLAGSFLAVLPAAQRCGVATRLLEEEIAYAKK